MILTKEEFKKAVTSPAKFLLKVAGVAFVVGIMLLVKLSLNGFNSNVNLKNIMIIAFIVAVISIILYYVNKTIYSNKITKELYDVYTRKGFISREYRIDNFSKFLLLILDENKSVTQKQYDYVFNEFIAFGEKKGKDQFNQLIKDTLNSKTISTKEFESFIDEFRESLEKKNTFKNWFSAKAVIKIFPIRNQHKTDDTMLKINIMYSKGKIIYFD